MSKCKWGRHAQLSIVLFGEWTFALYQKLGKHHREERLPLMRQLILTCCVYCYNPANIKVIYKFSDITP